MPWVDYGPPYGRRWLAEDPNDLATKLAQAQGQQPTPLQNLVSQLNTTNDNNTYWNAQTPGGQGLPIKDVAPFQQAAAQQNTPAPAASAAPFNPAFAQTMREIAARRLGINSLEEVGNRRINEDYGTALGSLDRGKTDVLNRLKTGLADRGILYSGANIKKQGEIQEDYSRSRGELDTQKNRSIEDLVRDLNNQRQELSNIEERATIDKNREDVQAQLQQALQEAQAKILAELQKMQPLFSPTGEL